MQRSLAPTTTSTSRSVVRRSARFVATLSAFTAITVAALLTVSTPASAQWNGMSEAQLQNDAASQKANLQRACPQDYWVAYAFQRVTAGGIASGDLCNIRNYNDGHWSSLTDLIGLMDCYLRKGHFPCGNLELDQYVEPQGANIRLTLTVNGMGIGYIDLNAARNIIAAGGGNIIAAGGGNIIAAGGGNIIAAGGGNIIAAGGGNIVGVAAGSLLPSATMQAVAAIAPPNASGYRLASVSGRWVSLGSASSPRTRGKDDKVDDLSGKLLNLVVPEKAGTVAPPARK